MGRVRRGARRGVVESGGGEKERVRKRARGERGGERGGERKWRTFV
jgi:hypothetical protein